MRAHANKTPRHVFSWWVLLAVGTLILISDYLVKQWALHFFSPTLEGIQKAGSLPIFNGFLGIDFALTYAENLGAAWGFLSSAPHLLLSIRFLLICTMIAYLFFSSMHAHFRLPLVCIISGALGNVIDYFLYGHVIDMFHFRFWGYDYPIFNLADTSICIGTFWILLLVLQEPKTAHTN